MKFSSLQNLAVFAWFVWVIVCLSIIGGLAYAAIHFISKYW